ncbi:MAG TPA: M48 family metallopeptidase [Candidatus Krumholzibacteria bacterium]|nr:M48 family metallopeptidase [Candidatus Krumholzibacteria bacterium]HRX51650.1 M48 family metallopeptidase [Candidatus Krumholzibacteria bacterium]
MKRILILTALAALVLAGCGSVAKMGAQLGQGAGVLTEQQTQSINRSVDVLEKTFEDVTPEQEYYIGRSVAASLLTSYRPLENPVLNGYVNDLGQTLAMASDRPETFGGYHFLVLDSDELNAFAAPGGLILVCRGLVLMCETEDELAAVLAHEVAHVQNRDGLRAIKTSRLTGALTTLSVEGARHLGGEQLRDLANQFDGSIQDVTGTLVNSGYARGQETAADQAARIILERVGYDPLALNRMLQVMAAHWDPKGPGFARTHPSPQDRLADIGGKAAGEADVVDVRQARFAQALGIKR